MPIGTHLDVNADSILSGQNPSSLVMCFFKHSDRIQINDIRVATEGESAAGYGWLDCLAEAREMLKRAEKNEIPDASEYFFRRAMDFIELAIARRRRGKSSD